MHENSMCISNNLAQIAQDVAWLAWLLATSLSSAAKATIILHDIVTAANIAWTLIQKKKKDYSFTRAS